LTRRSGDLPKEGNERLLHQSQTILKPQNLAMNANSILDDNDELDHDHSKDNGCKLETPLEKLW
jgi:hypothetical protein